MEHDLSVFPYLLMLLLQTLHIFEEIGIEAYKQVGTQKYLIAASILVSTNFVLFSLILSNLTVGYILGIVGALTAILGGFVHTIGYVKTKSFRGTVGAGVFTGIPLGIAGCIILYQLIQLPVRYFTGS